MPCAARIETKKPTASPLTLLWVLSPGQDSTPRSWQTGLPRICNSQDMKTRAVALGQTGKLHLHLGNFQEALPYLKQSLTIMQQIGDKAGEARRSTIFRRSSMPQGDYETALSYLKQSLAIRQQIGDKAGEGTTLNNISQIFKAQGDYETALRT